MARNTEKLQAELKLFKTLDSIERRRESALETAGDRLHAKYDKQRKNALLGVCPETLKKLADEAEHVQYLQRAGLDDDSEDSSVEMASSLSDD